MDTMSLENVVHWAASHEMRATAGRVLSLGFREEASNRVTALTDNQRPEDLVLLANRLVWVNDSEDDEASLPDGDGRYFFWVRESGIWNDVSEALASEAFGALLKAGGHAPDTKGLLVPESESRCAVLLVLHAMLFGWDAYLIPLSGWFICHISHDGYLVPQVS